jgi:transcription elongation GreA/GreB family factor
MQNLKQILRDSLPSVPKQKQGVVGIGAVVEVLNLNTGKSSRYFIAGDWTAFAGHKVDDATIISRGSPLAKEMLGKKLNDEVNFKDILLITSIVQ